MHGKIGYLLEFLARTLKRIVEDRRCPREYEALVNTHFVNAHVQAHASIALTEYRIHRRTNVP